MRLKHIFSTVVLTLLVGTLFAQDSSTDFLHSTGKIYSVVVGIVIIFIGIVYYIWRVDKKLTKIENQLKDEQ